MKITAFVSALFIFSIGLFLINPYSRNNTKSPGGAPSESKSFIPAVILTQHGGKLKAFRGFKVKGCGNPVYNEKDSIVGDFVLIVEPKQVLFTSK